MYSYRFLHKNGETLVDGAKLVATKSKARVGDIDIFRHRRGLGVDVVAYNHDQAIDLHRVFIAQLARDLPMKVSTSQDSLPSCNTGVTSQGEIAK